MDKKLRKIRIYHTNDLHSQFENMPHISAFFKQKRAEGRECGEETLFIDLGDHLDRMRMKTEVSRGMVNREILEASGYQWITLGNNEGITLTKEELTTLYKDSSLKVVLSNLIDKETSKVPRWIAPYDVIVLENGFRLGLFSLTVPFKEYYSLLGWEVLPPEEVIEPIVEKLSAQVDAIILLSHLGLRADRDIANQYPEIKVILGAHSHHLLQKGEQINQTLISQMGKSGNYVGEIILEVDDFNQIHPIAAISHQIDGIPQDPEINAIIDRYRLQAESVLQENVHVLEQDLEVSWDSESTFANLLAQGIRNWTDADISLVNSGQLLYSLPHGSITLKDLLQVCPHPINPCTITLSVYQLKEVLEEALHKEKMNQAIRGYGFRGEILGFPAIDGCHVTYTCRNDRFIITNIQIQGKELDWTQTLRIGTIDMFVFFKAYQGLKAMMDIEFHLPEFLRDLLLYELQRDNAIEEAREIRYCPVNSELI